MAGIIRGSQMLRLGLFAYAVVIFVLNNSAASTTSLADIKRSPENAPVTTDSVTVTAMFGNVWYVESPDRNAGIRVNTDSTGISLGEQITVAGSIKTDSSGERYILGQGNKMPGSVDITPLFMNNRTLGGGPLGLQNGVAGSIGLNNLGLLVRASGKVTEVGTGFIVINDGSGGGVKVISDTLLLPLKDSYVSVTGISSCWMSVDIIRPMIRAVAIALEGPPPFRCAGDESCYMQLSQDLVTSSAGQVVLSHTLELTSTKTVYLQSDGRYFSAGAGQGNVYITVDQVRATNRSYTDWQSNTLGTAGQHSFNCIGAVTLPAGSHIIKLISGTAQTAIGAGSNLCIMVNPADNVLCSSLNSNTGPYGYTTQGLTKGTPVPHTSVMSHNVQNTAGPIVALASGRSILVDTSHQGDAMWGIYRNGASISNAEGTWSVNDIYVGAETTGPMYCQALMNATGSQVISLDASEFPIGVENTVNYRIGETTTLLTMHGGMTVAGSAPLSSAYHNWVDYFTLASSSSPTPGGYVAMGVPKVITSATINIPLGHNGIVMFVGKTRCQGDRSDIGGNVFLWLRVDGVNVGSTGVQQVTTPSGDSQRTLCCSYLSAGSKALTPGPHTVQLVGKATGSFIHMCTNKDCPLIWFD